MTPLGHLATNYLAAKTTSKIHFTAFIIGGILPDLDWLLFPFSWFNQVHRVISHNFLFLILCGCIGFFVSRHKTNRTNITLSILFGGFLHLFIDSIIDNNPSNGIGIALLWPFSSIQISPFNIAFDHSGNTNGWHNPIQQLKYSMTGLFWEIPFLLSAGVIFLRQKYTRRVLKILKN